MKLYTESQVKDMLDKMNVIYSLEDLTPIKLPTYEEIENKGKWVFNDAGHTIFTHYNTVPNWVAGAKWVIEQITGNVVDLDEDKGGAYVEEEYNKSSIMERLNKLEISVNELGYIVDKLYDAVVFESDDKLNK